MTALTYKSFEKSLAEFENIAAAVPPISNDELQSRIAKLQGLHPPRCLLVRICEIQSVSGTRP
ncbi:hypothetical protein D3C71_512100 [compost metagenome]